MRTLAIILVAAGFLLMVLSPLWRSVASSKLFWDQNHAVEYAEAVANRHHAQTQQSLEDDPLVLNKYGELEEKSSDQRKLTDIRAVDENAQASGDRLYESQRKLARAREFRRKGGTVMRWLGAAVALIGLGLYQWDKSGTE